MTPRQYSLGNLRGALEALRDYPDDVMVTDPMTVLLRSDFPSLATRAIVARELSCTDRHIDRLIAAGRLQRVKLGSRVLITRDSVQALIDSLPAA